MKRTLSFLLSILMLLSMLPVQTLAAERDAHNGVQAVDVTQDGFSSFAELKALAGQGDFSSTGYTYSGSTPLVISEDLTLPAGLRITSTQQPVVVASGVSFTAMDYLGFGELTVEEGASMQVFGMEISKSMTVLGKLMVEVQVALMDQNVELTGEGNIEYRNENALLCLCYHVYSLDELECVLVTAEADHNPHHIYSVSTKSAMTINKSITLPDNFQLGFRSDGAVTIAKGCTLTTGYTPTIMCPVIVEGTLNNVSGMAVNAMNEWEGHLTIAEGGAYIGKGDIFLWGIADPADAFDGLNLDLFDASQNNMPDSWHLTRREDSFLSFEELKELAARNYDSFTRYYYRGATPLVIEEDLELPWSLQLDTTARQLIVPSGVSFSSKDLMVVGYLEIQKDAVMNIYGMEVHDHIQVDGIANVNIQIALANQKVTMSGVENVHFTSDSAIICYCYDVTNMAGLKEAIAVAKEDSDSRHIYTAFIGKKMTINESLTMPVNFQLGFKAGSAVVTVAKGCTLDLGKTAYPAFIGSPVTVKGTIKNPGLLTISRMSGLKGKLTIADGGSYTGTGNIQIMGVSKASEGISGVDLSMFQQSSNGNGLTLSYISLAGKKVTVTASNVASSGKIKLTWKAMKGACKYEIWRSTTGKSGSFEKIYTTKSNTFTNTGAKAGTKYYYKVRAVNAIGKKSDYSKAVSRVCDLARPDVTVSNVASSGKIKLSWPKVEGAVKYQVYRATSKSGTYKLMKTTTSTSYTNTSAVAGKTYYYKVKAIHSNTNANSVFSQIESRVCDLARPELSLKRTSAGKPKLSWGAVNGAVKYQIYRSTTGKDGSFKLLETVTKTSYTNSGAAAGKNYYYKVRAVHSNTDANSAFSAVKNIKAK